jgi:hypothetical protein
MKVICAWCQRAGNFGVLREKEPPGDEISHGICDEHVVVVMAEARRKSTARSSAGPLRTVVLGRLLVIVSRDAPGRFEYLRHLYERETVEVIVDRRVRELRRRRELTINERRCAMRRRGSVTEELENFGWTLVRY